ncbi:MAG: carboxypeptidase regulatory-like domain-containing protein [Sandaracinaceae bacterium]
MRAGYIALLCAPILLAAPPSTVRAQPVVRVRAESRIELRVERAPGEVRVTGVLRDDRGEPLTDQSVEVRVSDAAGRTVAREVTRTGVSGQLSARFPVDPTASRLSATFSGDERYRGVDVAQQLDLGRAHVRLGLARDDGQRLDRLDLDLESHELRVRAESAEGGDGLSVTLRSEVGDLLATGTTGADGTAVLRVRSERLGPPAADRLIVATDGDERRARAQTEVLVVRYRDATLSLEATPSRLEPGAALRMEGRLYDRAGPLPRRAVGLFAERRHEPPLLLDTVLTDREGRFAREVTLGEGSSGTVGVRARFTSDAPWRPSAESETAPITLTPPSAAPWPWLLVPMALCALAIFWVSRRSAPEPTRASITAVPPPAPPGIEAAERRGARGAAFRDVGGRVLDSDSGTAIAAAVVTLRLGDSTRETRSDAAGAFSFSQLAEGEHRLSVDAPGYESRDAVVPIPHGGGWLDARVRLRSLRELAVRHYASVAERLAPGRRWWALWTPRELLERARRDARAEATSLTEAVERAAYAAPHPSPEDVQEIGRRSESVSRSLDAR